MAAVAIAINKRCRRHSEVDVNVDVKPLVSCNAKQLDGGDATPKISRLPLNPPNILPATIGAMPTSANDIASNILRNTRFRAGATEMRRYVFPAAVPGCIHEGLTSSPPSLAQHFHVPPPAVVGARGGTRNSMGQYLMSLFGRWITFSAAPSNRARKSECGGEGNK